MPQEESVLRLSRDEALEAARLWQECGDAREFACRVLGGVMNALMDSEAQQMCGASRNERSGGRENSRNGYRPRSPKTAVGDVGLEIPKLRHGTYYPEGMLARWSRVDTSVAVAVQEMYVCGVSTRKVERVASKLGISSLSSSGVSSLCSGLDAEVAEFRRRDLSGTPCCYLWLDATYMSCRRQLERRVVALAGADRWRPAVEALSCIKGIDTLTAFRLAAEAGSFSRFRSAPAFASWCGLTPSERSSGETERRGGITKAGNALARTELIESAWHYSMCSPRPKAPAPGTDVPAAVRSRADDCTARLHRRREALARAGKPACKANAAVARELACWVWEIVCFVKRI